MSGGGKQQPPRGGDDAVQPRGGPAGGDEGDPPPAASQGSVRAPQAQRAAAVVGDEGSGGTAVAGLAPGSSRPQRRGPRREAGRGDAEARRNNQGDARAARGAKTRGGGGGRPVEGGQPGTAAGPGSGEQSRSQQQPDGPSGPELRPLPPRESAAREERAGGGSTAFSRPGESRPGESKAEAAENVTQAGSDAPRPGPLAAESAGEEDPSAELLSEVAYALFHAAHAGMVGVVEKLCKQHAPAVFYRDHLGRTALHIAAAAGSTSVISRLVRYGAAKEATDHSMHTPMHYAASAGRVEAVDTLHKLQASHMARDTLGRTPLALAAANGHPYTLRRLIGYGTRVNGLDRFGNTPLHWAAAHGRRECVRELVERGSDLLLLSYDNRTPRQLAQERMHAATSKYLAQIEQAGAKLISAARAGNVQEVRRLLKEERVLVVDQDGRTALHHAATKDRLEVVRELVSQKFSMTQRDKFHRIPLHWAAAKGRVDACHLLLQLEREKRERREAKRLAAAGRGKAAAQAQGQGQGQAVEGVEREEEKDAPVPAPPEPKQQLNMESYTKRKPAEVAESAGHYALAEALRNPENEALWTAARRAQQEQRLKRGPPATAAAVGEGGGGTGESPAAAAGATPTAGPVAGQREGVEAGPTAVRGAGTPAPRADKQGGPAAQEGGASLVPGPTASPAAQQGSMPTEGVSPARERQDSASSVNSASSVTVHGMQPERAPGPARGAAVTTNGGDSAVPRAPHYVVQLPAGQPQPQEPFQQQQAGAGTQQRPAQQQQQARPGAQALGQVQVSAGARPATPVSDSAGGGKSRVGEVREFLKEIDLDQYTDVLCDNGFDSYQRLLLAEEADLREADMKAGHRRQLLLRTQEVKAGQAVPVARPATTALPPTGEAGGPDPAALGRSVTTGDNVAPQPRLGTRPSRQLSNSSDGSQQSASEPSADRADAPTQ